jgi:hypothetical protein
MEEGWDLNPYVQKPIPKEKPDGDYQIVVRLAKFSQTGKDGYLLYFGRGIIYTQKYLSSNPLEQN